MAYSSIRTAHAVGDVVYYHDSEDDTVHRAVVVGIQARNTKPGYSPDWTVLYTLRAKFASDPGADVVLTQDDVHEHSDRAWPPIALDAAPAEAEAA